MKQITKNIVWLVACWGVATIGMCAEPFAKGPYLGQTPPGSTPQVFAPGLISDTRPHQLELWGNFSTDGNTFCFNRNGYVFITENTDQGWAKPRRARSVPSATTYSSVSPDANSIYFNYCYNYRKNSSKHYSRHRCIRTSQGWSSPQKLLEPSLDFSGAFSLAANNNFYFVSEPFGPHKKGGIFCAPFVDNTWPRVDHTSLNLPAADPGIAPDESFMVVTTMNQPGGYGRRDLYLTLHLPDGTWSTPKNMGPRINSAYFEYSPRISPDKKYLFFTRADGWAGYGGPGDTGDIYWVALKEYLPESHR